MTHFMKVAQKLGIVFLVGIALAGSGFQGTTLATDNPPTSPSLHARVTRAQAERAALTKVPGQSLRKRTAN
jgi:hypothetical protein